MTIWWNVSVDWICLSGIFWDEVVTFEYFSLDRVISYMLRLMIVERWSKMSPESGRKVFMEMIERFRQSFQFEEQFK